MKKEVVDVQRLQNKWRQTLNSSFLLKKAVRNPFEPINKTMLKYGMAKQHAVNKTNQLQNASGPKQSETKAPRKRQTDRFKMKYLLITIAQRMQVNFKRLQKWIPPLLRIGLLWQDAIPKSMAHFSEH